MTELDASRYSIEMSNFLLTELCNDTIVQLRNNAAINFLKEKNKKCPDLVALQKFSVDRDSYINLHQSDIFQSKDKMIQTIRKYLPLLG